MKTVLNEKEINKLIELRKKGFTHKKIGEILECTERCARKYCDHNKDKIHYIRVKPLSENQKKNIIEKYISGLTYEEISETTDISSARVRKVIMDSNIEIRGRNEYSSEEIEIIIKHYGKIPNKELIKLLPNRSIQGVMQIASKLGLKGYKNYWTNDDIEIVRKNYLIKSTQEIYEMINHRHSIDSIDTYAGRELGLKRKIVKQWSLEEINYLKANYSILPIDEIELHLTNRNRDSIINKASQLKLTSYNKLEQIYSDDEIDFLICNYKTKTDNYISKNLGRSTSSVKNKRLELNLFKVNKSSLRYESLEKFLRGQITNWKNESMTKCNYRCVLTDSKDFQIHHLYSFNKIVKEYIFKNNIIIKDNFIDYTNEELLNIANNFILFHNQYPLGICVDKKIHQLFHSIYGYDVNENMWLEFEKDFEKGKYNYVTV